VLVAANTDIFYGNNGGMRIWHSNAIVDATTMQEL